MNNQTNNYNLKIKNQNTIFQNVGNEINYFIKNNINYLN